MPSARLELAQLSPLPPQDSVSTNFTTTADLQRFRPCVAAWTALLNGAVIVIAICSLQATLPASITACAISYFCADAAGVLPGISAAESWLAAADAALATAAGVAAAAPDAPVLVAAAGN